MAPKKIKSEKMKVFFLFLLIKTKDNLFFKKHTKKNKKKYKKTFIYLFIF